MISLVAAALLPPLPFGAGIAVCQPKHGQQAQPNRPKRADGLAPAGRCGKSAQRGIESVRVHRILPDPSLTPGSSAA
jgi:hypothetical protein